MSDRILNYFENSIIQAIKAGEVVIIFDPKGDGNILNNVSNTCQG